MSTVDRVGARTVGSTGDLSESPMATGIGTSEEEMIGYLVSKLDQQRASQREARRAALEAQRHAQAEQVRSMHRAAELSMAQGIVAGASTIGTAVCSAVSTASSSGPGGQSSDASGVGAASSSSSTAASGSGRASAGSGWDDLGRGIQGGGQMASSILGAEAQHKQADAQRYEQIATREGAAAQEAADAAQAADRSRERMVQGLDQILQAKRQAEQAALRG